MPDSTNDSPNFIDFIEMIRKLEKKAFDVVDIPIKSKKVKEENEKESLLEKGKEDIIKYAEEESLEEVVTQPSKIEEKLVEVEKETKNEDTAKSEDEIKKLVKQIDESYPRIDINISNFYYENELPTNQEMSEKINSKLTSLESIQIRKKETKYYPFALCKVSGKIIFHIPVPVNFVNVPVYYVERDSLHKLLAATSQEYQGLDNHEYQKWIQSIPQLQLKISKLIVRDAQNKISKHRPPEIKNFPLDFNIFSELLRDYNEKIQNTENFSSNIYRYLESFVKEEQNNTKLWKEDAIFDQVKKKLRKQLETIQQNQKDSSHQVQVDFLKLRKIQRKMEAKTRKYKEEEKKGSEIEREEKEKLIREMRDFQRKKQQLQRKMKETKIRAEDLEEWLSIISIDNVNEAEEQFISNFKEEFLQSIEEILAQEDYDKLLDKIETVESNIKHTSIQLIYVPLTYYTFNAKQSNKKIRGSALYASSTKEVILLNP